MDFKKDWRPDISQEAVSNYQYILMWRTVLQALLVNFAKILKVMRKVKNRSIICIYIKLLMQLD